jgi:hypothetical protein
MNDRLKELAKQSGIWFEDTKEIRTHSVSTTTLERFAEMIIQECSEVATHTILTGSGVNPTTFTGTVTTVQRIKEHFGIKK